jgi:hypothetical protein
MLVFHPVHDLGEMGFDVGERQCLCHDYKYSHL